MGLFVAFFSPYRQIPGLSSDHDRFLPDPFPFLIHCVGFEVLITATMKTADVTPCSLVDAYGCFGRT
jgi:hypothetical protein